MLCLYILFKLSFVYADWSEEGILLLFLFVLISRRPVFIAGAMCELLNVTVAALCIYQLAAVTRAMSSSVVAGSAVWVSAHVHPQSRDLNQIQFSYSNFIRVHYMSCSFTI